MTFSIWGIRDFSLEYADGANRVAIPGASVSSYSKVWKRFTFSNITTTQIRVKVMNARFGNSRITEVEAYTPN